MKIAVCVKEVPDSAAPRRIDPATLRLDRSGEGALNPWDLSAVEEALRLVEAQGGEVVCVSMGPERAAGSLRKALAMGADRAVLVSDPALAGSDLLATSLVLADGARARAAPISSCSASRRPTRTVPCLWAAVADRLRLPLVSQAASLDVADGRVAVKRQTEYGYDVHRGADAVRRRGIGRHQRTALPLAQGDHGREEEAAGHARRRPISVSRTRRSARAVPAPSVLALLPPPPRGDTLLIEDDGSQPPTRSSSTSSRRS